MQPLPHTGWIFQCRPHLSQAYAKGHCDVNTCMATCRHSIQVTHTRQAYAEGRCDLETELYKCHTNFQVTHPSQAYAQRYWPLRALQWALAIFQFRIDAFLQPVPHRDIPHVRNARQCACAKMIKRPRIKE